MKFGPNGMKQLTASTFIAHITKKQIEETLVFCCIVPTQHC